MYDNNEDDCINSMWEEVERPLDGAGREGADHHTGRNDADARESPEEKWIRLKEEEYGKGYTCQTEFGLIDFSHNMDDIVGPKLTYDEYLDAQFAARDIAREWSSTS